MTDDEILSEAKRIERRRSFASEIESAAICSPQLIGFPDEGPHIRINLDSAAVGVLRGFLLDQFDAENPPHPSRK